MTCAWTYVGAAPMPGSVSGVYTVSIDGYRPTPGSPTIASTPARRPGVRKRRVGRSVNAAEK